MKKRITLYAFFLVVLVLLANCAGIKPITDMTPKQKATFFMSVYNSQYDDYRSMAALTTLTEEQKQVMRAKKRIMTEVYPLITLYVSWVDSGAVPSPEIELQIINLINQLTMQIIAKE